MSDSNSVQLQGEALEPLIGGMGFPLQFFSPSDIAPNWDAGDRDGFLRSFWKRFGNDILQAVLAVSVAKVLTQNFVITGPEKMAEMYLNIVRDRSDFYRGYSSLIMRGVQDYYTQDNGWFMERERSAPDDYEGPCLGLDHIDSARMYPTGNDDFPYAYMDVYGKYHLMHRSQYIRIVDLGSPVTSLYHHRKGFCALSRALSTAMILTLIVAMKREKLTDLPPSALAVFNNINKKQYEAALRTYGDREKSKGNEVWHTLLPLFGINPAHPADIKFISLREVWEGFNDEQATNIAVYAFAAAWRMDPREVWPVSSGPLGTGKEAEVQHEKAKAKSFGLLFTEVERAFNCDLTLPPMLNFKFQLEDTEEEKFRADIHNVQIMNIKSMQEAGASLTPSEVRKLLCLEWHILPRYMMSVPKEAQQQITQQAQVGQNAQPGQSGADQTARDDAGRIPPDTGSADLASVSDISAQSKEFGTFFGPIVSLNVDGTKEYHYDHADRTYEYATYYARAYKNLIEYVKDDSDGHLRHAIDDMRLLGLLDASQYNVLKGSIPLVGSKEYYVDHPEDLSVITFADSLRLYANSELENMQVMGAYKDLSLVASEQEGLLDRVKKMPRERRIAIQSQASKLRALMNPDARLSALESIPEEEFVSEKENGND